MTLREYETKVKELISTKPDCKRCGLGVVCNGCKPMNVYKDNYKYYEDRIGKKQLVAMITYVEQKSEIVKKRVELEGLEKDFKATTEEVLRIFGKD